MKRKTIDSYITDIIEESLKATLQRRALQEKEKQDSIKDKNTDDSAPSGEEAEKLKKGNITVDDIIEKLNSVRSGKSFNDDDVKAALSEYFNALEKAEMDRKARRAEIENSQATTMANAMVGFKELGASLWSAFNPLISVVTVLFGFVGFFARFAIICS